MDLAAMSDEGLLRLRADVDREIRSRKLGSSIGGIGEQIALALFKRSTDLPNLIAAAPGTKNVDALSRDGERYSIKTILHGRKTGTIYPDENDSERKLFEYLVVILIDDAHDLKRAVLFEWMQFIKARSWDKRMRAWYIARSERSLSMGRQIFTSHI